MSTRERDRRTVRRYVKLRDLARRGVVGVIANAMRDPLRELHDDGLIDAAREAALRLVAGGPVAEGVAP